MNPQTQKIVLFEFDRPLDIDDMLNYDSGLWFWVIKPGNISVVDDNGNTGYYDYTNATIYNIQSFRYEDIYFSKVNSLADCKLTDNSFYYDISTTSLIIHMEGWEVPISNNITIGIAIGYSIGTTDDYWYNNQYYEPRINKIFDIKKSIDPLFYGLLKYQSGTIKFANNDGHFDDWRSRNLFNVACRILVGDYGDDYVDFEQRYAGYIEDDIRSWDDFTLKLQDPRKALTQGVATNLLSTNEFIYLNEDNYDQPKPVAYGSIKNAPAYCTNQDESGSPSEYDFLFADTTFNSVYSISEIRVNGVVKTATTSDLDAGTFSLSSSDVGDDFDDVRIDFTVNTKNGVAIIKDLMGNYNNTPYLASFWDTAEVDDAETDCRDTSIYIDRSDMKLSEAIESICNDCDLRFFVKDDGKWTIRIYDANRTPVATIKSDDWIDDPNISNNGSEYLTSVVVGYLHDIDNDKRRLYENTDYIDETFDTYKSYKTETFKTELTTLADAQEKSETIMSISKNINDIVDRTTTWEFSDLEPTDFVIASPRTRVSEADDWGIYEVLNVKKQMSDFTINLSLRFVEAYTFPTKYYWSDEDGDLFVDENEDFFYEEVV